MNHITSHPIPPTLEPKNLSEAMKDEKWHAAMSDEFDVLLRNDTWDLVPRNHQNLVGCRWIFRIKRNMDGSIAKYKARLVAKGYH